MNNHGGAFGLGEENKAFEKYFIGKSFLNPLAKTSNMFLANVTFEPGCRNNWHIHRATKDGGQILIYVDGSGWYQEEGKAPQSLNIGMVQRLILGLVILQLKYQEKILRMFG